MIKFLTFICILVAPAFLAGAHVLGQSLEKEVDGYLIDVGYDAPTDKIDAYVTTRIDFNLWTDKNKTTVADFSHVWVRIAPKEEGITFAGFLHYPKPLLTGMSYTFQKAGEYEMTVRFLDKQDKALAEASFPLVVIGPQEIPVNLILGVIVGGFAGTLAAYLLMRRRSGI